MSTKMMIFAASALASAAMASAQAAPMWQYFPTACASDCSQTIESAYLCETQYTSSTTDQYACFCEAFPSDASGCATCLNSNNAAALANLLTSTVSACPQAEQQCFFECSFDTCASTDIACQCDGAYLENIYNCASCNTANNNTGTTQIADFNALQSSCAAQNYTGASDSFTTVPLASPTGEDAYSAPSLTATGGGEAATGDLTASGAATAQSSASSGTASASASATGSASTTSKASASKTSASATKSGASASASASGTSGAGMNFAPIGGCLALAGAVIALL
ncbi:hypothetical protein M231_02497 [Tremella mesenterica]|uniref:Extracellular membrane protein CFEM domain-containing protein n=1 Tax=Tremella mesenterica TaxID=5217 RepID=A0A4Q1BQM0_TREME|nr:uncharacterized protein TREMEDRAFT_74563 [Tremella mesenterica DSM 1558]EIW67361.1 hypothetical protein TREMEDRAFT_74563 [Tremella mesenterica DSM 1558]RXK40223.1 hypothetical protein M231_02497 [Tremella mesenterica]